MASYQYLTGADDPEQQLFAAVSLSERLLEKVPRITLARAYYQKDNIGRRDDDFFESTVDTFYGYEVGLEMSSGVAILWDTRYVYERGTGMDLNRRKVTSIQTAFLF
jgi:hypothetical protein